MSKTPETFQEAFQRMMSDRIDYGSNLLAIKDPRYVQCRDKSSSLFEQLFSVLNEEYHHLLFELEEETNAGFAVILEYAYKQGFRDGIQLSRELDSLGIEDIIKHFR